MIDNTIQMLIFNLQETSLKIETLNLSQNNVYPWKTCANPKLENYVKMQVLYIHN